MSHATAHLVAHAAVRLIRMSVSGGDCEAEARCGNGAECNPAKLFHGRFLFMNWGRCFDRSRSPRGATRNDLDGAD
jgi:hypothetical protein